MEKRTQLNSSGFWAFIAVIVAACCYLIFHPHDDTTRFGRAMDRLSTGANDAARELNPHRSTADKIGAAVEDAGESIRKTGDDQ
jgi:hypothetical protein